jgi:hypothetical protein
MVFTNPEGDVSSFFDLERQEKHQKNQENEKRRIEETIEKPERWNRRTAASVKRLTPSTYPPYATQPGVGNYHLSTFFLKKSTDFNSAYS